MTAAQVSPAALQRTAIEASVQAASRLLQAAQDSNGSWHVQAGADITLVAEALLAREYLGCASAAGTAALAARIRAAQLPAGHWPGLVDQDATEQLTASVLCYLALRLAGDSADAYHLAIAAGWVRDAGGLAAVGPVGQAWLAAFGLTEWAAARVPGMDGMIWPARQLSGPADGPGLSRLAATTLSVLGALRPVRRLPFTLAELRADGVAGVPPPDRGLLPALPLVQQLALRRSGQWLVDWQQREPLPVGGRPAWPLLLIALRQLGYPLRHPALSSGLTWLDTTTAGGPAEAGRRGGPEVTGGATAPAGPAVRATATAVLALTAAGWPASETSLALAGRWLLAERIDGPPEHLPWPPGPARAARERPGRGGAVLARIAPSGWSFAHDCYPAVPDSALVLIALSRIDPDSAPVSQSVPAVISWLGGQQARDGSWSGSALVTALVVRALAAHGPRDARALRRGVIWLLRAQHADGSWSGSGGSGELAATAEAVTALLAAGVLAGKPSVRAAVGWLRGRAVADGGWRADQPPGRYRTDDGLDAAATARALGALLASGALPHGQEPDALTDSAAGWLAATLQAGHDSAPDPLALAALARYVASWLDPSPATAATS